MPMVGRLIGHAHGGATKQPSISYRQKRKVTKPAEGSTYCLNDSCIPDQKDSWYRVSRREHHVNCHKAGRNNLQGSTGFSCDTDTADWQIDHVTHSRQLGCSTKISRPTSSLRTCPVMVPLILVRDICEATQLTSYAVRIPISVFL